MGLRISILILGCLILFQNCSVYQSEDKKSLTGASIQENGCYPYIDTNMAASYLGVVDAYLTITKTKVANENGYICDFNSEVICKISPKDASDTVLLKTNESMAFPNIVNTWISTHVAMGFIGLNHGGFTISSDSGSYTLKYLALDGNETKGVGCEVTMTSAEYTANGSLAQNYLANLATEMAHNNQE